MDRTLKITAAILAIVIVASIAILYAGVPSQKVAQGKLPPIYYFYGKECPHCAKIEPFITNMTAKYPDAGIQVLEVWHNQTNQQIYDAANSAAGISSPPGVPEVVIGKTVLVGEVDIPAKFEGLIQDYLKKKQ